MTESLIVGPVLVGPIAHGGHCVARHEGRVIFVRHALPGELVRVQLTDQSSKRFWRGDAVEIVEPSPDRVAAPCAISGPGGCGGCDFQHVELAAQRRLKAGVVAEQLQRLAGVDWAVEVEAVPDTGAGAGLGWRTRMRYHVDDSGHAGLRGHRSHQVMALPAAGCLIAAPAANLVDHGWTAGAEVELVAAASGPARLVDGVLQQGPRSVTEQAAGRHWQVDAGGFWQVHPAAADTLVAAVLRGLQPEAGERAFDLYCGVGLFAGALADAGLRVWGVEANRLAIDHARQNLADCGDRVRFTASSVERLLSRPVGRGGLPGTTDLVVLDPPRTGAGAEVINLIAARRPRAIAYVACDPAALARDVKIAADAGYRLSELRAFDLFPMTHHVECVALLEQTRPGLL